MAHGQLCIVEGGLLSIVKMLCHDRLECSFIIVTVLVATAPGDD